jgi:pantothenate kinase
MKADLWETLQRKPIYLDRASKALEIERDEVKFFYAPLGELILNRSLPVRREIVAVAGPPGSGKSAFAAALTAVVNALAGRELAATVGLDGWHYPNAYLDTHLIEKDGNRIPLRKIKGAPETYDHEAIGRFLEDVQSTARLTYPVYSRETHDPFPADGLIETGQRVVILEGNYWLLDEPPWCNFRNHIGLSIFLKAAPETLLDGLRERHLRGGKTAEWVEAHLQSVDLPNIKHVLAHSTQADVIIKKANSRRIQSLVWRM